MGPIFNEKIAEKWNLWVRKQCMDALFTIEKSTFVATVQWTVTVATLLLKRVKKKKKSWNALKAKHGRNKLNPNLL